eukprot:TRINITY_DN1407_c0_g1_i1.p1 TRINITY_DN1407_c0_g1~~TRINITY_DN1407_c0_g1_i1.p1  ORF type:complete len:249 (+),score=77.30 TRINITY_DN1407_c0_g1_i1:55-801(+)
MGQSFQEWVASLGQMTQILFYATVFCTLTATLGMIPLQYLVLDLDMVVRKFQVWRLVTSLIFFGPVAGPGAFPVLIMIYLLLTYSKRLEEFSFKGKMADYVWCLFIVSLPLIIIGGWWLEAMLVSQGLVLAIVWIWARRNSEQALSIMGFFEVKAQVFPWVLTAIHWIFGQGFVMDLVGIVAGHVYIYGMDYLPHTHGVELLKTPAFLKRLLPDQRLAGGINAYVPLSRQAPPPPQKHSWGPGRVLGS